MIEAGVIASFTGDNEFLSNFYHCPFVWRGTEFPTGEHAFSFAKANAMDDATITQMAAYQQKILDAPTPTAAKKLGRAVSIDVEHWDKIKVQYMREIVHAKFKAPGMGGKLINTGANLLVEGNTWGDVFWGRCEGKGFNILGAILMEERGYWLHSDLRTKLCFGK